LERFVESHGGKVGDISIYGKKTNATKRRLAIMNLAIRGIEADVGRFKSKSSWFVSQQIESR
jgi:type I restriction enzyme M protein